MWGSYDLKVDNDGSFHATAVPPGRYKLQVEIRDPSWKPGEQRKDFGSIEQEVVVPPAPKGAMNEVADLGDFEIRVKTEAMPKKPVIGLSAQTADGKTVSLSDHRGKCVLLTFWAPWAPPSAEELEALKTLGDAFGGNPRFAMIGVALENNAAAVEHCPQVGTLKWINARIGGRELSDTTEAWGVDSVPAMFLIGPDGAILVRDPKAPRLRAIVEESLKTIK